MAGRDGWLDVTGHDWVFFSGRSLVLAGRVLFLGSYFGCGLILEGQELIFFFGFGCVIHAGKSPH